MKFISFVLKIFDIIRIVYSSATEIQNTPTYFNFVKRLYSRQCKKNFFFTLTSF